MEEDPLFISRLFPLQVNLEILCIWFQTITIKQLLKRKASHMIFYFMVSQGIKSFVGITPFKNTLSRDAMLGLGGAYQNQEANFPFC